MRLAQEDSFASPSPIRLSRNDVDRISVSKTKQKKDSGFEISRKMRLVIEGNILFPGLLRYDRQATLKE